MYIYIAHVHKLKHYGLLLCLFSKGINIGWTLRERKKLAWSSLKSILMAISQLLGQPSL